MLSLCSGDRLLTAVITERDAVHFAAMPELVERGKLPRDLLAS